MSICLLRTIPVRSHRVGRCIPPRDMRPPASPLLSSYYARPGRPLLSYSATLKISERLNGNMAASHQNSLNIADIDKTHLPIKTIQQPINVHDSILVVACCMNDSVYSLMGPLLPPPPFLQLHPSPHAVHGAKTVEGWATSYLMTCLSTFRPLALGHYHILIA